MRDGFSLFGLRVAFIVIAKKKKEQFSRFSWSLMGTHCSLPFSLHVSGCFEKFKLYEQRNEMKKYFCTWKKGIKIHFEMNCKCKLYIPAAAAVVASTLFGTASGPTDDIVTSLLLLFWRFVCLKTQCGLQQPEGWKFIQKIN